MHELQAINSKVNLSIETSLTMTQKILKMQKRKKKSRRNNMLTRSIRFVFMVEINGTT